MANTLPASPVPTEKTQFSVLLFTDICASTGLKATHGAMAYKAAAELHNALVERLAAEEHLTLIKNTGDGYFARTTSVAAAVRFALRLQYGLRNMEWPSFPLATRVGIHAGEVADITTLGQPDVLAPAADLVARVMSLAVGGQVLLTRGPFDEARHFVRAHPDLVGDVSLTWLAHGPYLFKGCEEPVEVFEVGLTGCAPLVAPPDGEKARRALRPGDEETLGWRPAEGLEIPGRPGWRIAGKLGAGGFGEVWAGERDKTHERRAYKFCFDAERLRALKREVTLTRLLRETLGERDDIVRIYDLRLDEPPYFLESELATEGNLLQWAEKQGGLAAISLADRIELVAATATALAAATATALAAAHSVGVLHKDIKPTNVLIFTGKDGRARPRLVDFGIGTLTDTAVLAQHGITGAGFTGATVKHSSGTPTYSPPEYLAGKAFTVQGDVFSLGVMLYQLVTAKADAPLAEGWQRDVPDELLREDIALCVDGDPARRLPGATELATRLRALAERRAEIARRAAAANSERARMHRQRVFTFATVAALLVAAITVPLALWALHERGTAIEQRKLADEERKKVESREREKAKLLHDASIADYAVALNRIEKDDRWSEGIAHFARALDWEPSHDAAATTLYGRVAFDVMEKSGGLRFILANQEGAAFGSWSPDGTRIVTAGRVFGIQVWDAATGKPTGEPMNTESGICYVSWSPDGTRLLTASNDDIARVWDAATSKPLSEPMKHKDRVNCANWSPDGMRIVTACNDKTVRVWEAASGKPESEPMRHSDRVEFASFSPDGGKILASVVSFKNGGTQLWDAVTGKPVGELMRDEPGFSSYRGARPPASWSPNCKHFVTTGRFGVQVWDSTTGTPVGEPFSDNRGGCFAIWGPDGTQVLVNLGTGDTFVYNVTTGRKLRLKTKENNDIITANWSPDGMRIATQEYGRTQIWDAATGVPLGDPMQQGAAEEYSEIYLSVSWSPDGLQLLSVCFGTALVWEVPRKKFDGETMRHNDALYDVQWSPDGRHILTASADKTARIWDTVTGRQLGEPIWHSHEVHIANWSLDGRRILTASGDNTARVWDTVTGRQLSEPMRHGGKIHDANWSPDGFQIVTACADKTARLWDAATGKPLGEPLLHGGAVQLSKWSPDGETILTVHSLSDNVGKYMQLWDPRTRTQAGKQQEISSGSSTITDFISAVWNPDGMHIVTATDHARDAVGVWKPADRIPVRENISTGDVASVNWNFDGTRLITVSNNRIVQVWDPTTGKNLGKPKWIGDKQGVVAARISPDDSRIAISSGDHMRGVINNTIHPVVRICELKSLLNLPVETKHWVCDWVWAVAGWKFDGDGVMQPMTPEDRVRILYRQHNGDDPWSKLARWRATDPAKRTIHPDSQRTCREIAERERDFGSDESLNSALDYDPTVPLARLLLAGVILREDAGRNPTERDPSLPQRAAFLRDYDLKRMPDDPMLWARAVRALHEQQDEPRARRALTRLEKLAPDGDETNALRELLK